MITTNSTSEPPEAFAPAPETILPSSPSDLQLHEDDIDSDDAFSELENVDSPETESDHLKMLESHSQANLKTLGEIC